MLQEERSERSRAAILEAALALFSHRGYGATSMRDIAGQAGVSTGSVYHHFKDKESIFQALLEQFQGITQRPDFPINVALEDPALFDDFGVMAGAAREVLARWRAHLALFYVDAVEFDGRHIQRFYAELAHRFEQYAEAHRDRLRLNERLREGVPAAAALLFVVRAFIYYYSVETLFGVQRQFGLDSADATRIMADILRRGILQSADPGAAEGPSR